MTTTTTIPAPHYNEALAGWLDYVGDDCYTPQQRQLLAEALFYAEVQETWKLLPQGWHWYPMAGQVTLPAYPDMDEEVDIWILNGEAVDTVCSRFREIEAVVLCVCAPDDEDPHCPVCAGCIRVSQPAGILLEARAFIAAGTPCPSKHEETP
jgi:hypothetical protein